MAGVDKTEQHLIGLWEYHWFNASNIKMEPSSLRRELWAGLFSDQLLGNQGRLKGITRPGK